MNKHEFRRLARKGGWHPDRIAAWLYCHKRHGASFPNDDWTIEDLEQMSEQTLEIYLAETRQHVASPRPRKSMTEQVLDSVGEGMAEVAAHIWIHAAKQFFRRR